MAGRLMCAMNEPPDRLAIAGLDIQTADTILEMGFGPGHALQVVTRRARCLRGCGDPAATIAVGFRIFCAAANEMSVGVPPMLRFPPAL